MKKKHMTCSEIAKYICTELDEQIDSPKCRAIKKHLTSCPHCTAYLKGLKQTVRLYREEPDAKLSRQCREKLFEVLNLRHER